MILKKDAISFNNLLTLIPPFYRVSKKKTFLKEALNLSLRSVFLTHPVERLYSVKKL